MKAVITVVGKDRVGILAEVSTYCSKFNVNINDVTQSVLSDIFCMIMLCDITEINSDFISFADGLKEIGKQKNMQINVMHEDIFNSMHNI